MPYIFSRLAETRCTVGECPVWDGGQNRLLWTDIPHGRIYVHDFNKDELSHWDFPERVCSFGLTDDDRLVVALTSGVYLFDVHSHALTLLVDPEPEQGEKRPANRLNDGKVGPDGAFWVGSMHAGAPTAALHRVTPDGRCERKVEGLHTSNGLAFSHDGRVMIHTDSRGGWIDRYALDPATGELSGRARIATPGEAEGRPDGGAFDLEDCYWSAGVSAGCINRYDMSGRLLERIHVPVRAPTMPCFGGPDMKTLFFTSLRRPDEAGDECGNVFMMEVDVAGVPVGRFKAGASA
ncbi:SMP-30/gluconolactonase/LRE family protein [Aquamicrobium sp. LC103]|uniref:SMP-30/gluconolactonase/LRE family protein n=1 Tax=Aquamicrobium sp. LC103 TaxID=1120658 RepID=UPI00063E76FD|nr:SMP-30/gluconolactonase/LRE family protein [Aquamicrobium sp. LC103]TKT69883.1 SMP-30/gluconolactonase/LRE family protein [Aquamicrobium sp. LC103]